MIVKYLWSLQINRRYVFIDGKKSVNEGVCNFLQLKDPVL